jgi:hypothetical protein
VEDKRFFLIEHLLNVRSTELRRFGKVG